MNLLKNYLLLIKKVLIKHQKVLGFSNADDLKNMVLEIPPEKFNFDLSSNVAMVLSKKIDQKPIDIANKIKSICINNIEDFS